MLRLKDLVVSFSIGVGLLACSGGAETNLLNSFFMAARSGDNATIAAMSATTFPGEGVQSWEVIEVSEETSVPFQLGELRTKAAQARSERDIQFEKGKYFLEDNYEAIEKIQLKLDEAPDYEFSGALGEVQAEWEKIISDRKSLERTAQQFNREAENEAKLANMSLMAQTNVNNLEGVVLSKHVLVSVTEEAGEKTYAFELQKFDVHEEGATRSLPSRWIIVSIEEKAT
jgi:hypothetical protein